MIVAAWVFIFLIPLILYWVYMMVFGWFNLSLWVRIEVGRREVGNRKKLDAV